MTRSPAAFAAGAFAVFAFGVFAFAVFAFAVFAFAALSFPRYPATRLFAVMVSMGGAFATTVVLSLLASPPNGTC